MPLCREAVLGPAFTPGSLLRPSRTVTIGPPAAFGGETAGRSADTTHPSQWTRPLKDGPIPLRGEGR
jgi:hypothetical protein